MSDTRAPLAIVTLILLLFTVPAQGQVYKWVDERGVVNYGSAPPPDRVSQVLDATIPINVVPRFPMPSAEAQAARDNRLLALRLARLEAELDAARRDRSYGGDYDALRRELMARCEASRGVDCDLDPYGVAYVPLASPGFFGDGFFDRRHDGRRFGRHDGRRGDFPKKAPRPTQRSQVKPFPAR